MQNNQLAHVEDSSSNISGKKGPKYLDAQHFLIIL